ncbi:2-hydroxyacid dehydrogenase [Catenovulum sediminis]|uniref:2-hydroxyacid dehydrogenase n=1 Tax=Catenovulum sediminis TaxID=1740262 RepID=UPI00117FE52F|nr:2-hydroxyacid dehydrogenase [Catenovulum sediminis]
MSPWKLCLFSTKPYDKTFFEQANNAYGFNISFFDCELNQKTVVLAKSFDVVCVFVNDNVDAPILEQLKAQGVKALALRCAGYNNVDLNAAKRLGIKVVRVPEYSPEAVAEHTVGLMLTLSRKFHKAYNRVKEDNFALNGLLGFNLHKKTVGIIGTGKIGQATSKILQGFGCTVLAYDPFPQNKLENEHFKYVELDSLIVQADIISLHCPLTQDTQHLINDKAISMMKNNVMLINTSRGGLIDTKAAIQALKSKKIGYLGLDVYEQESDLFFEDLSNEIIDDDIFQRLLTFPNVLITGHQGFFTQEALTAIATTTLENIKCLNENNACPNQLEI